VKDYSSFTGKGIRDTFFRFFVRPTHLLFWVTVIDWQHLRTVFSGFSISDAGLGSLSEVINL